VYELLIALAVFATLAGLVLLTLASPVTLAWLAVGLTVAGLLVGLPTGFAYHVLLRRELLALGPLPGGWYWHPTRYHARLSAPAMRRIWPYFLAGALGFLLIVLGGVVAVTLLATMR
jgi:hypothetical protein